MVVSHPLNPKLLESLLGRDSAFLPSLPRCEMGM